MRLPPASPFAESARGRRAGTRWRKMDFATVSIGQDEQIVSVGGGVPRRFPGFAVDFVEGCREFKSIGEHMAVHGERHGWESLQIEALRSWMPELIESGLLVSAEDLHGRCAGSGGNAPAAAPSISAIGFPTGGERVDLVERALGSFANNARTHGRAVEFLVADSSSSPGERAAFRDRLGALARERKVPVRYAGEDEKRVLAGALARTGIDPEIIEFALFDPLAMGFACGANRNALLLREAGRMFCSIDDDVICELAAPPAAASGLKLFSQSDPFWRAVYQDHDEVIGQATFVDRDFLAAHEELLGRELPAICGDLTVADLDLDQVKDELLRRIWARPVRVRATFSGHLGDPGIPTSIYYLYYGGENRRRLTSSPERYRAALGSRNLLAVAPRCAIGDASLSPGMAMGLDHRELLPPFFPVLHAEDFVFGATLWQCASGALLGHVPLAIRHEPRPGKSILQPADLNANRRAVIFEFAHLLRRVILHFARGESASTAERMQLLGRHLRELAAQPSKDFTEFIRAHVMEHESAKLDRLEEERAESTDIPEFWHRDVAAYVAHVRESLTAPDFDIPFDLKGARSDEENRALMQRLFARFGALLEGWPEMVRAAREMRERGEWMKAL